MTRLRPLISGVFYFMEKEIWKDVVGYEGLYQVSSLGRVKGLARVVLKNGKYPFICKEKIIKNCINTGGYYYLGLSRNTKTKSRTIHQLMAEAFFNHKPCGMNLVVDHINNDRLDNRLENLQIITNRENASKDIKNKSSKYTGVSWCKKRNKWTTRIRVGNKYLFLGYYINEEDANLAYQNKLKEIS
jgi:hypothetical protein